MFLRISRPQIKWVTFLTLYLYYTKLSTVCQVFFKVFLFFFVDSTHPPLPVWHPVRTYSYRPSIKDHKESHGELQTASSVVFTSPSFSSGVYHISCRVSSSISCHHPQSQTVHRAAMTSMTRPFGCLPVGTQTGVGCIPTKTQQCRVLVELSLLFHLSVDILLQFLFVCSYSLVHDMVNAELFAK